jgi:5-methylcytosine-specific restriction endonuclease McrA
MLPFNSIGETKKICTSCLNVKPLKEFYKDITRKDGHSTRCKECHKKLVKKWQMNNKETFRKINREWKQTHKKQHSEQSKKSARANPEKIRAIAKRSREKHPETRKNWQKENKDKIRNYTATRKARLAGNGGNLTVEEWYAILDFYGHKCLCCGRDDVKLTIDHVLPIFHGGQHSADNVQPLCGPCNSRKKDKHIDYRKEKYHAPSGY